MNDKPEQFDTSCRWVVCSPAWIEAGGDCATAPRILCGHGQGISHMHPAHQGEPVALPARKITNALNWNASLVAESWNACLDEIAKLGPLYTRPAQGEPVAYLTNRGSSLYFPSPNIAAMPGDKPLYTHADPAEVGEIKKHNGELLGEVDTLTSEVERLETLVGEIQALRLESEAQLAERDALLLRAVNGARFTLPDQWHKDYLALSASAEPTITYTGDDITEGRDLLGKGLGRIVESTVVGDFTSDIPDFTPGNGNKAEGHEVSAEPSAPVEHEPR